MNVAIVADDLTSAADAAGPFVKAGVPGRVLLDSRCADHAATDVIAIDTNSRGYTELVATAVTAEAMSAVRDAAVIIKTVDSTLRGHLAAEVGAALAASGRQTALVAPAFPAQGRCTRDGVQYVHDIAVADSCFGSDASHPAVTSSLYELFPGAHAWAPGAALPAGVAIADASTDTELDAVVASVGDPSQVLWVGSPGLSAAIARAHDKKRPQGRVPVLRATRTLVTVGSRHDVSLRQLAELVPSEQIVGLPTGDISASIPALMSALEGAGLGGLVDESVGNTPIESGHRLAAAASAVFAAGLFDAIFVTGGATARAVLEAMEIRALSLVDEPEPGVVVATALPSASLLVVVKAGGFGDVQTFRRLHQSFTRQQVKELS